MGLNFHQYRHDSSSSAEWINLRRGCYHYELNRLAFLDWARGVAVLIMIPCHTFNAFARADLRGTSAYVFSQFIGGMAAPLFLFLAGITFAFQIDKLDRAGATALVRLRALARRGGYVLLLAYLFRLSHIVTKLSDLQFDTLWKVDILNCMGAAMLLFSLVTLAPARARAQTACVAGLAVAALAPVISGLDWSGVPPLVKEYLAPNRLRFPLFPWSAYVAFGIGAGLVIRRTPHEHLERTLQWGALAAFGLVFGAQYFANLPYSLYSKVDFWTDSPALVLIRTGLVVLTLAGAYVWTEYLVSARAGWIQVFGKTSLMVYWVHIMIVYGALSEVWKANLSIAQTTAATLLIILVMIALSHARLWQKAWWAQRAVSRAIPNTAA